MKKLFCFHNTSDQLCRQSWVVKTWWSPGKIQWTLFRPFSTCIFPLWDLLQNLQTKSLLSSLVYLSNDDCFKRFCNNSFSVDHQVWIRNLEWKRELKRMWTRSPWIRECKICNHAYIIHVNLLSVFTCFMRSHYSNKLIHISFKYRFIFFLSSVSMVLVIFQNSSKTMRWDKVNG